MSDAALQSDPQSVRKVREGAAAWWFRHPRIMLGAQKSSCSSQTIFTHSFVKFYINFLCFFFLILSNFRLMEFLEVAQRTPYILLHRFTQFLFCPICFIFRVIPHPLTHPQLCTQCVLCSDLFPETSFTQLRFIFYNSEVFRHTFPKDRDILSCKPIGNITLIKYHYLICSSTQLLSSVPVMFFLV